MATTVRISTPTDPFTIYGARAAGTPSLWGKDGLQEPVKRPRITWTPPNPDYSGQTPLAAAYDNSSLFMRVRVQAADAAAYQALVDDLDAAVGQFSYTVTVSRTGAPDRAWTCYLAAPTQVERTDYADGTVVAVLELNLPTYAIGA